MAGNHNSGRKTIKEEVKRAELIELSDRILLSALKSDTVEQVDKLRIALQVVTRDMTTRINHSGSVGQKINWDEMITELEARINKNGIARTDISRWADEVAARTDSVN